MSESKSQPSVRPTVEPAVEAAVDEQRSPSPHRRRIAPQRDRRLVVVLAAVAVVLAVVAVALFVLRGADDAPTRTLSEFGDDLAAGRVTGARLDDASRTLTVTTAEGDYVVAYPDGYGPELTDRLLDAGVPLDVTPKKAPPLWADLLIRLGPIVLLLALLAWFLLRRGGLFGGFLQVRDGEGVDGVPDTRFSDVAGHDEVIGELREIVDYFDDPDRFERLGASMPRGILLTGPPGTGKTLLARAVAGESGVPFMAIAGSDFVEMFAGVGASRVRRLFTRARKAGKAIIFIDEIDAIGKKRVGGNSNGESEERENTLNQLLVELDGFRRNDAVFVLAATNRTDVLDPALLRAGRFDRKLEVPAPDRKARAEVLRVHARGMHLAGDVDFDHVAAQCPGMTGADLSNVVNQAALHAARRGADAVAQEDFRDGLATIMLGAERRSRVLTPQDRRIAALHEAGHTVCALLEPDAPDPVHVTIVPRGDAGGVTWLIPPEDQLVSRRRMEAQLVVALGGRAAEDVLLDGDVTQGAAGDLRAATAIAREMVTTFGMSDLGLSAFEPADVQFGPYGAKVHETVQGVLDTALTRARAIVRDDRPLVEAIADALDRDETLDAGELDELRRAHSGR